MEEDDQQNRAHPASKKSLMDQDAFTKRGFMFPGSRASSTRGSISGSEGLRHRRGSHGGGSTRADSKGSKHRDPLTGSLLPSSDLRRSQFAKRESRSSLQSDQSSKRRGSQDPTSSHPTASASFLDIRKLKAWERRQCKLATQLSRKPEDIATDLIKKFRDVPDEDEGVIKPDSELKPPDRVRFNLFIGLFIVLNTVFISIQTDTCLRYIYPDGYVCDGTDTDPICPRTVQQILDERAAQLELQEKMGRNPERTAQLQLERCCVCEEEGACRGRRDHISRRQGACGRGEVEGRGEPKNHRRSATEPSAAPAAQLARRGSVGCCSILVILVS